MNMKAIISLLSILLMLPSLGTSAQNTYSISSPGGFYNGFGYIDLGLQSGTLWATCNLGAENPWDKGNYYAWGETSPKNEYIWDNYKFGNGSEFSKYNIFEEAGKVDSLIVLEPIDDAATQNMGKGWKTPNMTDVVELINSCNWGIYHYGDVKGYLAIGPNGNTAFFPISGYYNGSGYIQDSEFYWMSNLVNFYLPESIEEAFLYPPAPKTPNKAFLYSPLNSHVFIGSQRCDGLPIRAVISPGSIHLPLNDIISERYAREYFKNSNYDFYYKSHSLTYLGYKNYCMLWSLQYSRSNKTSYIAITIDGKIIGPEKSTKALISAVNKIKGDSLQTIEDEWAEHIPYLYVETMVSSLNKYRSSRQKQTDFWKNGVPLKRVIEDGIEDIMTETGIFLVDSIMPTNSNKTRLNDFVKSVVTINKSRWEHKDEFETTSDFQKRMSYPYYQDAIGYYAGKAIMLYQELSDIIVLKLEAYDIENETFLISSNYGYVPIKVPYQDRMNFRNAWVEGRYIITDLKCKFNGETIILSEVGIATYKYDKVREESVSKNWEGDRLKTVVFANGNNVVWDDDQSPRAIVKEGFVVRNSYSAYVHYGRTYYSINQYSGNRFLKYSSWE